MRVKIVCAALLVAVLAAVTQPSGSSAQAAQTDYQKVVAWELSRPGLDLIGSMDGYAVIQTDFGFRRVSKFDQSFEDIDLPGISQVAPYLVMHCDAERVSIFDLSLETFEGTADFFGLDAIDNCWILRQHLYLLGTVDGVRQITEHRLFDGVPVAAGELKTEIVNPVEFADAGTGGLLITNAEGQRYHTPSWGWTPRLQTVGDFFVGEWPATRDGDVLTLYGVLSGEVSARYEVSESVDKVLEGPMFATPTDSGTSLLAMNPPRIDDARSFQRTLELPFVPDRITNDGYGTLAQSGELLAFIPDRSVVLSQSHEIYDAFSGEVVKLRMWGNNFTSNQLVTGPDAVVGPGNYNIDLELVEGGFQFVPPLMRPGNYGLRFDDNPFEVALRITMQGWYQTSQVRITGPDLDYERYLSLWCTYEESGDAGEQWSAQVKVAFDRSTDVAVGSVCRLRGENTWWGPVGDGVTYDYLNADFTFTVTSEPIHLNMSPRTEGYMPLWLYVHRSGGASEPSREVELICGAGSRTVYDVPYDQPMRLLLPASQNCVLVAFENEKSDLVGIYEYLDFGEPARAFREGIEIDLRRPAWYDIVELIIHPLDDSGQFVTQQYSDFLGRKPTPTEAWLWATDLDSGKQSNVDLVMSLLGSLEYQNVADPNIRLYQAYFDRLPDAEGLQYWMDVRRDGYSIDLVSEQFTLSSEFRNLYGDTTDADFIRLVYENVLGRTPDPDGYAYWQNLLSTGQITRGQLMVNFSESAEYAGTYALRVRVVRTYIALLNRVPGAVELSAEETRLAGGANLRDLATRIVNGNEYEQRFRDHYRGDRIVDLTAGLGSLGAQLDALRADG